MRCRNTELQAPTAGFDVMIAGVNAGLGHLYSII